MSFGDRTPEESLEDAAALVLSERSINVFRRLAGGISRDAIVGLMHDAVELREAMIREVRELMPMAIARDGEEARR
jgi:hypothetical protein